MADLSQNPMALFNAYLDLTPTATPANAPQALAGFEIAGGENNASHPETVSQQSADFSIA